jgi:ADP-heptose:LPS heptosyltransferase
VFTTPTIAALRRAFPDAYLAYVVEPAAAPVLQGNPHLDELTVLPRRRGMDRIRDDLTLARRLRRARFDVAIDLHGGPRSALLTWASRAPMRIGYTIRRRSWMYTHVVPRGPEPSTRHSVANQWDLLAPLGIAEPANPDQAPVEMAADPDADARVTALLADTGFLPPARLIVVHVSASNPFKRWPASHFVELLVRLLAGSSDRRACVVSGPSEPEAARQVLAGVEARLPDASGRLMAPQLSLSELRALVARAAVYIGGDSGPLHVASTTATPIVELLGPTVETRSFPWRPRMHFTEVLDAGSLPCRPCTERHCVPGDFRCLTRIAPERVHQAAERALGAGAA